MKYAIIVLSIILSGCQMAPPEPFVYGDVTAAPIQCKEYQNAGGFCSLQFALDEVHARFSYQPDHITHADLNSFAGVDIWQKLPADGKGDCEDFALTMRWYLNRRGITGTNLLTVYVEGYGYHVALELDGWVMDNSSPFPRRRQDLEGWQFLKAGDESGVWKGIKP